MTDPLEDAGRLGQLRVVGGQEAAPHHVAGPAARSTTSEVVQADLEAAASRISLAHLRLHVGVGVLPRALRSVAVESMSELDAVATALRRLLSDLDYAAEEAEQ